MPPANPPRKTILKPSTKSRARQPWQWSHNHLIAFLLLMSLALTSFISLTLYLVIALNIPDINSLASYQPAATTLILDDQGKTISAIYKENRYLVDLGKVPKLMGKAFVAAEDSRFFQHGGVDGWSILRALIHNLRVGGKGQGGSTITQQVARSLLLSPEKTYTRKIKEAILAYRIDKVLSKNDILHIYLNQIYLGEGAYGVGAAAMTYFGKPVSDLNLAEISILAGLPQAPSRYSPFKHFKKAKRRQAYVLNRMAEDGYITPTKARKTYLHPLFWQPQTSSSKPGGEYFVQHVKNYLNKKYGAEFIRTSGLQVFTTLDLTLQKNAAKAVRQGLAQWGIRQQASHSSHPQAALVSLEIKTGQIKAMMGGVNFKESQFNRSTQAKRQPGSAFKPIIYAAALSHGLTPNTMINDEPIEFIDARGNRWEPRNFSGKFFGPTTLRNGLVHSRNIVTIKLLQEIGIKPAQKLAKDMGIRSNLTPNLSLALGASELSLLEMTSAYTVFASGGQYRKPLFIKKIIDRNGKILEENRPQPRQVLKEEVAYQMNYLLKGVIEEGTGQKAKGVPFAAGKTGTTDRNIDAWFIGYTPMLVTGVWMGHDQHKSLGPGETGGRSAAPIWLSYMKKAKAYRAASDFVVPEGITFIPISRESGDFEYLDTDNALWEAFRKDRMPAWKKR